MRFHTARLPGRQGHPGWLAPLSWCPRPGLNISGRLSAGFGAGEGSYTFTASALREPPSPPGRTMPVEEFVAGWISGALGLVLGHPFDTVKVRLQTQSTYRGIIDCTVKTYRHESAYCLAPFDLIKVRLQNQTEPRARQGGPPPRYRGPVHCAASIFQEEGPRGLFRGAWALTLRDTPTLGIYFVSYEWLCRQATPDGQNPSSTTVLVAGGFAGITSWVTATPLDVIKSRMQMAGLGQREYQGLLDCMVSSARQEGLGVFFRGLTINSARAFPVNAVTFLSYEYLLHLWG
ncbi:PREDICTED: solute carrier family 25 member 45 isoform X5 [Myotis brandtii]|uniref:solute carrier family 25 member 45 isoform X5 n=1 Tax=Myotis brandtii TaxID=109478 RepID=UPI000703F51C|nr:PREDICTED: solute carrier family 25 member 45 isoform X5 [Myotis brandtii]